MKFQRITKREARRLFAEGKEFYLLQCNFRPYNMWVSPCPINGQKYLSDYRLMHSTIVDKTWNPEKMQMIKNPDFIDWKDYNFRYLENGNNEYPYVPDEINAAWDRMYNNWQYYNSGHEEGYYPHYYVEVK